VSILHNNLVQTSKKTYNITITEIRFLIKVNGRSHVQKSQLLVVSAETNVCKLLNLKVGGIYRHHNSLTNESTGITVCTNIFKIENICRLHTEYYYYCQVSGISWLIITGSGLDDSIYWHFFTITTNYNSSQSMAQFLTGLRVSSLLRDWFGSDLRIGQFFSFRSPLVNTPQLNTNLSYE
jgi:hypothetical protein